HADGSQVAEGVRDVARYVHSVLGMDDVAFRASVFAEQKQLAAFSSHAPAERRKLVMQLLGITPLDGAREQSRKDAKAAADRLHQLRTLMPDRAAIEKDIAEAEAQAISCAALAEKAGVESAQLRQVASVAATAMEELTAVGHEYDSLVREGQGLRRQRDEAAARFDKRAQHLAALDRATARLNEIRGRAEGLDEMEGVLAKVRALAAAEADLAAIPAPEVPPDPDSLAA